VARDRKRAKQRRERRASRPPQRPSRADGEPGHVDVPGALEHASADVDEFDAALVLGAGGPQEEPLAEPVDSVSGAEDELQEPASTRAGGGLRAPSRRADGELADGELDDGAALAGVPGAAREQPSGAPLRGGNRAVAFIRASWAELQRVQWPDRRHVTQATAVVLGFVAFAGAYLGIADFVAKEIVEYVL
jgi:preprotein translocase subunit SecE